MLYINFSGAALHSEFGVYTDHAPSNLVNGLHESRGYQLATPALLEDVFMDATHPDRQTVIADVVAQVEQVLAPFDVQVVTQKPLLSEYTMIVVGGRWGQWMQTQTCTKWGHAALDCDGSNPSDIGFVASECLFDNVSWHGEAGRTILAHTILHEAAHTWGLVHNQTDGSIMCTQCAKSHQSLDWGIGPVANDVTIACGNTDQDDYAILMAHLGPAMSRPAISPPPDTTPPVIKWLLPG